MKTAFRSRRRPRCAKRIALLGKLTCGGLGKPLEADFKVFSLLLFCFALISCPALAQPPPPLQPPHGEIGPSLWEQYHLLIIVVAIAAFLFIITLAILFSLQKPASVIPPPVVARRALMALQQRSESDATITEASQILRRYITFAFNLPSEEFTSTDLNQKLQSVSGIDAVLLNAIANFFRQCDEDKFSPPALPPHVGAASRALQLLDRIEARRIQTASQQPVA
jgi:hypothetical protein